LVFSRPGERSCRNKAPLINNKGLSHIAFHVNDVEETVKRLITKGGKKYGELIVILSPARLNGVRAGVIL
jgi:hypothetical protein